MQYKDIMETLRYFKWLAKHKYYDKLTVIGIENSTACNRKCPYCPNFNYSRGNHLMSIELWNKIIDDLAQMNYTGSISPGLFNEPLIDERLPQLIKYARQKLPKSEILIYSNGDLVNEKTYKELKKAGVTRFRISQHDDKWKNTFMDSDAKLCPDIEIVRYHNYANPAILNNRGGLVDTIKPIYQPHCYMIVSTMWIDYTGKAILCCNDYLSSTNLGNVREKSINEIWTNSNYRKVRLDVLSGIYNVPICRKCNGL
ncbi:MAG: radical SAM/SPASM domain-containing protein [Desulfobaccales bacterium]